MLGPEHARTLARESPRRPQVAVGVLLSGMMAAALVAAGSPADAYDGVLRDLGETELFEYVRRGLDRHPSVMLAGIAALAVPMVALIAAASRAVQRWRERRAQHLAPRVGDPIVYRSAWIEVPGLRTPALTVGEIVRIGDSDDCDLAVAGTSTGVTCALIQRTSDCEFFLFDVSAGAAYLAVNGARSEKCRLSDGDRIEIGSACLVFRTGEATPLPLKAQVA